MGNSTSSNSNNDNNNNNKLDKIKADIVYKVSSYNSENDKYFKVIEKDLNILQYIELNEFKQLLYNFSCTEQESVEDKEFSSKTKQYDYEITKEKFHIFFKNKILSHFAINSLINDKIIKHKYYQEEKLTSLLNFFYNKFYDIMYTDFKYYNKHYSLIKNEKLKNYKAIKKTCLLAYAFLYCQPYNNSYYNKALFVFNLFSNHKGVIYNHIINGEVIANDDTNDLMLFFFFVILIPSNISLVVLNEVKNEYEDINLFTDEQFKALYDGYEFKDSYLLLNILINSIFGNKDENNMDKSIDNNAVNLKKDEINNLDVKYKPTLNKEEFIGRIAKCDWIFTSSGVRYKLDMLHKKIMQ